MALTLAAACGSGISDEPLRTGELQPTPTPLPTATPVGADEAAATSEPSEAPPEETTPAATEAPAEEATPEPTEATAEEPAQDVEAAVAAEIEAFLAESGAPGAVVAIRLPDDTEYVVAGGVSDITAGTPLQTDDWFWIGSITKPVTSVVILQLAEEGLLSLDEPVETYLPGWSAGYEGGEAVTVRQLLNHTNGFIEYAFDPAFYAQAVSRLDTPIEPQEIIDFAKERGPQYEIGTEYLYNTTAFLVAGQVIEAVTGSTAAAEIRTRILEPLGMTNTVLPPTEPLPEPLVHNYNYAELAAALIGLAGEAIPTGAVVQSSTGEDIVDTALFPQALLETVAWTGGGLRSQAADVNQLMEAIYDGTLLSAASLTEMTAPTLDIPYGLGLSVDAVAGEAAIGHGGGVPGFRSDTAYLTEQDIAVTVLTNGIQYEPDVGALTEAVIELLVGQG